MKDRVLSIQKMQKLKELGIDISKASMAWYQDYDDLLDRSYSLYELTNFTKKLYNIPTFTLQDIIEMLPDSVEINEVPCYLDFGKDYVEYISDFEDQSFILFGDNMLENMYKILIWLLENKYI